MGGFDKSTRVGRYVKYIELDLFLIFLTALAWESRCCFQFYLTQPNFFQQTAASDESIASEPTAASDNFEQTTTTLFATH